MVIMEEYKNYYKQSLIGMISVAALLVGYTLAAGVYVEKRINELTGPLTFNFEQCAESYPVMESNPAQCVDDFGNGYMEDVIRLSEDVREYIESKSDLIVVESPLALEVIESPLMFSGEARGPWFFEGSFSVLLTDWDGRIIAIGNAMVDEGDNWMTEDFAGFNGSLSFENPSFEDGAEFSKRGTLIFEKSNPSGLPANDDALEIPIRFE